MAEKKAVATVPSRAVVLAVSKVDQTVAAMVDAKVD